MNKSPLTALSPLDGRYADKLEPLAALCSEAGLIRQRVRVEISWFKALARCPEFQALPALDAGDERFLDGLWESFGEPDAQAVKAIEATTNHDVKAVEYWLKDQFAQRPSLAPHAEFIHFACTSEDINNVAWALILKTAVDEQIDPLLASLDQRLESMAVELANQAMLSRTHGQTASPTTLGKELANVVFRLRRQRRGLTQIEITAKLNGAVGNFNAHIIAAPEVDWPSLARDVIEDLGLVWNPYTTQIEPHDYMAELAHALMRINTICLDLARDIWGYISWGYFAQELVEGEVGSSTMPHKINPIDFENSEGNLGLANALWAHMADKLPISRFQRDLSDSTVQRSLGSALGYTLLAWHSLSRGLSRIRPNRAQLDADLAGAWEVLGEAIQTVMRAHQLPNPYERLKSLTRGQTIDAEAVREFIEALELPEAAKTKLLALTPQSYTGNAQAMASGIKRYV
ncbi:MAG TPA: adenylosuccinate lyase [Wenzhouxiangella sp.]